MYTYDAIGSYERTGYSCQGSGKDLMQPVLDNQLKAASPLLVPPRVSFEYMCGCRGVGCVLDIAECACRQCSARLSICIRMSHVRKGGVLLCVRVDGRWA